MNEQPNLNNSSTTNTSASASLTSSSGTISRRKRRHFKDKLAAASIAFGGLGVIAAVLLIFLYLLYEVVPLFRSAAIQQVSEFQVDIPYDDSLLHLALE